MTFEISLLFPRPQHIETTGTNFTLPREPLIYLGSMPQQIHPTAQLLANEMTAQGMRPQFTSSYSTRRDAHISLQVNSALLNQQQSYRLLVGPEGITLIGSDEPGLFYGFCTLIQLLRLHARDSADDPITVPSLRITDWPDFPHRGVMLDVSRDKVPTMQTLFDLVVLLASWKINQLQLYMEHTFAYRGHEVVWQTASPFTPDEILALDAFCHERYVELVPNQNSFGHMHRWLKHEPYRRFAECPEGFEHPWNLTAEPYSLCPTDPGSLALLSDLYDQLLPNFSSRQFNVGLDETIELGLCRSAEICAEKGTERVYLEFLQQIHRLVSKRGRTMQFWSDIIMHRPGLIADLPKDAIALEWGYEAEHPFAEHSRRFAESGLSFYVCPGTSSWLSLAGRTQNAVANLSNAAVNGMSNRATGLLNTDWGDYGHMQPLPVSYLGFLVGAGFSWNSADAANPHQLDVPALLDAHAFRDQAGVMGRVAYDLGNAYLRVGTKLGISSALFWPLIIADRALPEPREHGLSVAGFENARAYIDQVMAPLGHARMARPDAELILREFQWVADMLRLACRIAIARLRSDLDQPVSGIRAEMQHALANELRPLIGQHREVWLRRNRPGGLDDSAGQLERTLALLAAD